MITNFRNYFTKITQKRRKKEKAGKYPGQEVSEVCRELIHCGCKKGCWGKLNVNWLYFSVVDFVVSNVTILMRSNLDSYTKKLIHYVLLACDIDIKFHTLSLNAICMPEMHWYAKSTVSICMYM